MRQIRFSLLIPLAALAPGCIQNGDVSIFATANEGAPKTYEKVAAIVARVAALYEAWLGPLDRPIMAIECGEQRGFCLSPGVVVLPTKGFVSRGRRMSSFPCRHQVLLEHSGVSCRDPQESECGTFRVTTTLLPVAQRVNRDAQGAGEGLLGQPDEATQGDDVIPTPDPSLDETLPHAPADATREICRGQFFTIGHLGPLVV